jgi:GABA(A) receptor-associated protein
VEKNETKNNCISIGSSRQMSKTFKIQHSLEERQAEFAKITGRYPDRIPIICERAPNDTDSPLLQKVKYLFAKDQEPTFTTIIMTIRKQMGDALSADKALFFMMDGNIIPPTNALVRDLYEQYKSKEDGFLYITYSAESTFG